MLCSLPYTVLKATQDTLDIENTVLKATFSSCTGTLQVFVFFLLFDLEFYFYVSSLLNLSVVFKRERDLGKDVKGEIIFLSNLGLGFCFDFK